MDATKSFVIPNDAADRQVIIQQRTKYLPEKNYHLIPMLSYTGLLHKYGRDRDRSIPKIFTPIMHLKKS